MKKILYTLFAFSATFFSCQQQDIEPEMGGENIKYSFLSGTDGVTDAKLAELVKPLHLFVVQNDDFGNLIVRKEFASIADITPINLKKGHYQFAYISNVSAKQIEIKPDENELTIYAPVKGDTLLSAGDIFIGVDENVVIGEQSESKATLSRIVGGVDLTLTGLSENAIIKSVKLLNSLEFYTNSSDMEESAADHSKPLFFDMKKQSDGSFKGFVTSFETCDDKDAIIEFTVEIGGRINTYPITLKNKVRQNTILTVNAKAGDLSDAWSVVSNVVPWGDRIIEDFDVDVDNNRLYINSIEFDITDTNVGDFSEIEIKILYPSSLWPETIYAKSEDLTFSEVNGRKYCKLTDYKIEIFKNAHIADIKLRSNGILYQNFKRYKISIEPNVKDYDLKIVLPAPSILNDADERAMFDLRDSIELVSPYFVDGWGGEDINKWDGIVLSEDGSRVTAIGSSVSSIDSNPLLDGDFTKTKSSSPKLTLPKSFLNLTELAYLDSSELPINSLPSDFNKLTKLRVLKIYNYCGSSLPMLPSSLEDFSLKYDETKSLKIIESIPVTVSELRLRLPNVTAVNGEFDKFVNLNSFTLILSNDVTKVDIDYTKMPKLNYSALLTVDKDGGGGVNCQLPTSIFKGEYVDVRGFARFTLKKEDINTKMMNVTIWNNYVNGDDLKALKYSGLGMLGLGGCQSMNNFDWIGELSTLVILSIINCPNLTKVPDAFNNLPILRSLGFHNNVNMSGGLPGRLLDKFNARPVVLDFRYTNCGTFSPTLTR